MSGKALERVRGETTVNTSDSVMLRKGRVKIKSCGSCEYKLLKFAFAGSPSLQPGLVCCWLCRD